MSATTPCGLPCEQMQLLSMEQILRLLMRMDDAGCVAYAAVQVEEGSGTCDLFIDCDNAELAAKQLFFSLLQYDDTGCPRLRVIID